MYPNRKMNVCVRQQWSRVINHPDLPSTVWFSTEIPLYNLRNFSVPDKPGQLITLSEKKRIVSYLEMYSQLRRKFILKKNLFSIFSLFPNFSYKKMVIYEGTLDKNHKANPLLRIRCLFNKSGKY